MKLTDILAKLGVGQSAETKPTQTAEELSTLAQSLNVIETAQATKATELTTLETTLNALKAELSTQATELSTKESTLTQRETTLADREKNLDVEISQKAAKITGQNAPAPVKPEGKELASPEAFATALQAEKDPAKQIELYRKHKAAAKAAFKK